ncbi:alpha-amylase family glycosyl hydrolase [Pseudonocardia acaciae]|uniref:alpha-amylase family glycosyl hydrolase n=1 Tax=Pseudonocardia acaciae TaxID=551276 RepID=UPI00048BCE1E|nr:alpha-amylase family glycosyl hydrolase [Pseudonocardia acaciae]
MTWWRRAVIYEIYPRSFADGNGDGIGDIRGIIGRLDYLAGTLGVDAIWCGPLYPSPQVDFGYDISDMTDIDPVFGDLADFDELVAAAHARNLRVIIDFVPNHTSDRHPWFVESRSSRDNPKRDWYVWADPKPDGSPPSNWTSEQGGSTWELDEHTGQYYLHSFHRAQPDVNWRNPELRAAMLDVLRFWLDRGVDGFRIDVLHMIAKHPELRDNPVREHPEPNPTDRQHPDYDTQWHVHDRMHPDLHGYIREMRAVLDEYSERTGRERIAIGEIEAMPWDAWVAYLGEELDGVHFTFNFNFIEAGWDAESLRGSIEAQEAALPAGAWPNYVLSNLDRPRLATRNGPDSVRVAAMLLLTLRGTPTLYYGDELGLADIDIPPAQWQDPLGRDQERAPMPWTARDNGGFTGPGVRPWLPVTAEYLSRSVESQLADEGSVLGLYRRLLAVRRASPALVDGDHEPIDTGAAGKHCLAYLRRHPDQTLAVLLNLGPDETTIELPAPGGVVLSSHDPVATTGPGTAVRLRGYEGVIVEIAQ